MLITEMFETFYCKMPSNAEDLGLNHEEIVRGGILTRKIKV